MYNFTRKNIITITIIILITAITMAISGLFIYKNITQPKYYKYFINTGYKYLQEGKYEEAILTFDKAIIIHKKSTDARIALAKAYIGNKDIDNAIDKLQQAQYIDMENEKLLLEILEILKDIDLEAGYKILQNYLNKVGFSNISNNIKYIVKLTEVAPTTPIIKPEPGTYINKISIKLILDEMRLGHIYYYTTDGSNPNKNSLKYTGSIDINTNTDIKIIGYNPNGEVTEIITLEYIIDKDMMKQLNSLINECEVLIDTTNTGINVGNCVEGAKEDFIKELEKVKNILEKSALSYDEAKNIQSQLNKYIEVFKSKIIEETNRNQLKTCIDKANNIYNGAVEGTKDGEFRVGSKDLLMKSINEAKKVYKDILARQNQIDNSVNLLNNAINTFNNSKVSTFTKEIALQYAINKYGKPFTHPSDYSQCDYDNTYEYVIHDRSYYIDNYSIKDGLRYYDITIGYGSCQAAYYGGGGDEDYIRVYENGNIDYLGGFAY